MPGVVQPPSAPARRALLPAVVVLLVAAFAALPPLAALGHQLVGQGLVSALWAVPFACVGVVVARRQPGNAIGWLLIAVALLVAVGADAGMYALRSYTIDSTPLPLARVGVLLAPIGWDSLLLLLPLPILLFPDGTLPSPRWRRPLVGYLGVWSVVLVGLAVVDSAALTARHLRLDSTGELQSLNQTGGWFRELTSVAIPLYALFTTSFVVAQVLAYRRADALRRQQAKWLLAGGAVTVAGLSLTLLGSYTSSSIVTDVAVAGYLGAVALPLAMGVAILRYRLYDIDRLISRTLSYTAVTALLAGVFLAVVLLTTQVLPFSSPVGIAASTLAATALFNPLRRRVQRLVDRRFNRARYDAEALVAAFSARLRAARTTDAVQGELVDAVEGAVEPAHVSLWVRPVRP